MVARSADAAPGRTLISRRGPLTNPWKFGRQSCSGIVQGVTEFLPISSSAHLIIFPWLLDWDNPGLSFDAALHLGTLVAVVVFFRAEIARMIAAIPHALSNPFGLLMGNDRGAERARTPTPGSDC